MYEGKYVYCVIPSGEKRSFGNIGIGGRGEVYTIGYRDIGFVVSDTPVVEYEPNETNALVHEEVVERIMGEYTVLPLKFGTVFRDAASAERTLARLYREFKSELERLDARVEVGVRVFWEPEAAMRHIENISDEVSRLKKEIARKTKRSLPATYQLRQRLERLMNEELNRRAELYSAEIFGVLKKQSEASQLNRLVGHTILNAAFLVRREKVEEFGREVRKIQGGYLDKGMEFRFSGPWPPYNFVRIRYA